MKHTIETKQVDLFCCPKCGYKLFMISGLWTILRRPYKRGQNFTARRQVNRLICAREGCGHIVHEINVFTD